MTTPRKSNQRPTVKVPTKPGKERIVVREIGEIPKLRRGHSSYDRVKREYRKEYLKNTYDLAVEIPKGLDLSFYGQIQLIRPSDFEDSLYDLSQLKPFANIPIRFKPRISVEEQIKKTTVKYDLTPKLGNTAIGGHLYGVRVHGLGMYEIFFEQVIPAEQKFFEMVNLLLEQSINDAYSGAERERIKLERQEQLRNKYQDFFGKTVRVKIGEFKSHKDFLIAVVGDSFMSGEGNPMQCGRERESKGFVENIVNRIIAWVEDVNDRVSEAVENINTGITDLDFGNALKGTFQLTTAFFPPTVELIAGNCATMITAELMKNHPNFVEKPLWIENGNESDSLKTSRSIINGTFQAALKLETKYPGLAASYFNYATSGAQLSNLHTFAQHPSWQRGPQVEEVSLNVRGTNRVIDALIIGGGINDAGFSSMISGFITGDLIPISKFFGNNPFMNILLAMVSLKDTDQIKSSALTAIEQLDSKFEILKSKIESSIKVNKVFLMEYPNALFTKFDEDRRIIKIDKGCGVLDQGLLEISREEARTLHEIGDSLNYKLKNIANKYGWSFVNGITEEFMGHGYCSKDPYFVNFTYSCKCQGNYQGMLHVNRKGYEAISEVLVSHLEKQFDFKKLTNPIIQGGGNEPLFS